MAVEISKVDVWAGPIQDEPGALNKTLAALAEAGANLEFVVARRAPEAPGTGVVFVAPLTGAKQLAAAKKAKLKKATSLCSLRLEGPDTPGFGARTTAAVAEAGVNMRGLSAAALGRKCVVYFAFDSDADMRKARAALKKALTRK